MTAMQGKELLHRTIGSRQELLLVGAIIGILLVLFTPIPALLLDLLLVTNVSIGLLVLLLSLYMDKPLSFSTFPTLLLIATLFRLSLNIAATRLILSDGYAGEVIGAIGTYVVGGNYVIGLVVFTILIIVQYIVVTNGAQRVAEVAARFTLDSMPGKQMSIDADLNMGLIDEHAAKERRKNVEREANFYGAMDGASKFVKGDAIAGIMIIMINIIGGLTIGIAQHDMSWAEALHRYTLLTVGDGIVTQIPALVISTATGIIVTRAATDAHFSQEITRQVAQYPKSLLVVAMALGAMLMLPGIPAWPVLTLLALALTGAYLAFRGLRRGPQEPEQQATQPNEQDLYQQMAVAPIEIVVGSQVAKIVGGDRGLFMDKVKSFRKQFALEMGFVFPNVQLIESADVDANQYVLKMHGSRVADAALYHSKLLAIKASQRASKVEGVETRDPTYGLPAVWIDKQISEEAKSKGYTIVDPLTVLITHFSEFVRNNAHELLTRGETEQMVARVKQENVSLYEELIPNVLGIGDIQKVLQLMLKEKVSIRNIALVMEALVDVGKITKDSDDLTEVVRQRCGRMICESLLSSDGSLRVLTMDMSLEQSLQAGLRATEKRTTLLVDPLLVEQFLKSVAAQAESMMAENIRPVLLCSPSLRRHIKRLTERALPHLSVLALTEIPASVNISSFGIVRVEGARRLSRPAAEES